MNPEQTHIDVSYFCYKISQYLFETIKIKFSNVLN